MSKVIAEKEEIVAVADAIRDKTGVSDLMTLSEMADSVKTISGGTSQPDWNATEGESGYILNKPFGVEYITLFEDTISFGEDNNDWYSENEVVLVEGESYTVTWNGIEYTCTAGNREGDVFIGNIGILQEEDSGVPFIFMYPNLAIRKEEGIGFACMSVYGETEASVSIVMSQFKKIDNKYIDIDYLPKKIGEELLVKNLTVKSEDIIKCGYFDYTDCGAKFIIFIDGVRYEDTLKMFINDAIEYYSDGFPFLGNIELFNDIPGKENYQKNNLPFAFVAISSDLSEIAFEDAGEHQITLYKEKLSRLPNNIINFPDTYTELVLTDVDGDHIKVHSFHNRFNIENGDYGLDFVLPSNNEKQEGYVLTISSTKDVELIDPRVVCSVTPPTDSDEKYRLKVYNKLFKEYIELRKQVVIEMNGSYYYPISIHIGDTSSSVEICDHGTFIEIHTKE